ncbi:MAG: DUF2341 domain-containing protein [Dehalococcoidia bacterium]|nr:DUF2341 domain-containing protein [Dehalococcoidia bacterium]MDD5493837.1 DUF2341 domain-containing protein [Dehalococcoidia bacterium]
MKRSSIFRLLVDVVFLLSLIVTILPSPASAAPSFIPGWTYRKQVTIAGSTAGALPNYQLKLTVNRTTGTDSGTNLYLGSNCAEDYKDLRFTKNDGSTLLDYWIESATSSSATVWIEFTSIPISPGTATFYCYYGNASATAVSNIQNTFVFGDDFEDGVLDTARWVSSSTGGTVSEAGGMLTVRAPAGDQQYVSSQVAYTNAYALHAKARLDSIITCAGPRLIGFTTKRGSYNDKEHTAAFRWYWEDVTFFALSGNDTVASTTDMLVAADTTFHVTECRRFASGGINYDQFIIDGGAAKYGGRPISTSRFIEINSDDPGKAVIVNYIFLRNYVSPEPAWGAWGPEETGGGTITAPAVTNASGASNIAATAARLNGQITDAGGENPTAIIYWGDSDGGTDPAAWAHNEDLGLTATGTFYKDVAGLTASTAYYYRCYASNSAGSAWASASASFTTGGDSSGTLAGWSYRKQVSVSGSSAGAQTNYQKKVTVYKGSGTDSAGTVYLNNHCRDDFADIRFTRTDGATLLDYWVESYVSGVSAVVWVELDSVAAAPAIATFYCYYGNASAATSSNIRNTFVFGDDFDDGSLDTAGRWSSGGAGGTISESGGTLTVTNSADDQKYVSSIGTYGSGYALHTRARLDSIAACTASRMVGFTTTKATYMEKYMSAAFRWYFEEGNFFALSADDTASSRFDLAVAGDTAYHTAEYRRYDVGGVNYDKYIMDGGAEVTGTRPVATPRYIYIRTDEPSKGLSVDWVFLRNFVSPEPAWGSWGSEEVMGGGLTRYEYYDAWDTISGDGVSGIVWKGQTFTPSVNHTVKKIRLKMWRAGTFADGTITLSIKATDGLGVPTGVDLCAATLNSSSITEVTAATAAYYDFDFSPGVALVAGTKYAYVLRFSGSEEFNWPAVLMKNTDSGYVRGDHCWSPDSGASWIKNEGSDHYFEEWGIPGSVGNPAVTNAAGATSVTTVSARLNGEVSVTGGENPVAHIYWGTTDGGTTPINWAHHENLGAKGAGVFFKDISGLTDNTTYYYRCYAVNSAGSAWAAAGASFTTGVVVTAPLVTNSTGASDITSSFARLNGEITSTGGADPVVHVYWGTADGGTVSTAWAHDENLGTYGAGDFSKDLSGLASNMTYYYRCYAVNSGGPAWADSTASFFVPAVVTVPVVTNGSGASGITTTSAVLNGTIVSTGGVNPDVRIYWGTTDGGTDPAAWGTPKYLYTLPAGPFAGTVYGLTAGTTYYYRCWATNSAGTGWAPGSATFTTTSGATLPVVTNSTGASGVTQTSAQLNGELVSTNGLETSVRIYYGTTDGGTDAASWTSKKYMYVLPVGTFSSKATGLTAGTTYYYRCWASSSAGTSWASSSATFTTTAGAPVAPAVTNASGATSVTGSSARLNGNLTSTGGENPTVHVYWGTTDGGTTAGSWAHDENLSTLGAGAFYKDVSGLAASTTYYYRCYAVNSGGAAWAAGSASFTTTSAPAVPPTINCVAAGIDMTTAQLMCDLTSTGGETPTVHVYWGATDGGTTAGSWAHDEYLGYMSAGAFARSISGLTCGTSYYFRCYASNSAGGAWAPSSFNFTTLGCAADVTNGLGATLVTSSSAKISYNISRVGVENPTIHIYWGLTNGGTNPLNWAHDENLGVKGAGFYEYDISGLTASTAYYYTCYAVNSGGESWATPSATFTTSPVTISPPDVTNLTGANGITSNSARLWGNLVSTGGENPAVRIYWGTTDGGVTISSWAHDEGVGTLGAGAFFQDISGLTASTTYYYRCYAVNSAGADWAPSTSSFTTSPPAVVPPTVTNASGASGVTTTTARLNGNLTSTGGENPTVYIYWGTTDGGTTISSWANDENLGALGAGAFFSDVSSLTGSTTYYYRCYAVNSAGAAWASSSASFTTPAVILPLGVTTNAPTGTTPTSTTLQGTLTGLGADSSATVNFEYGTSITYGNTTPDQSMLAAGVFSASLATLSPNTSYHYRAVALGNPSSSVVYGDDVVFATGSASPPTVSTTAATNVTETAARLNGNLTGTGGENPTVRIYWGTVDGGTTISSWGNVESLGTLGAGTFLKDISGLTGSVTYYYRCYAVNSGGATWAASGASFTTAAPPAVAPTVTNSTGASGVGQTSAQLNGELVSTGGLSTSVRIYYGTTDGGTTASNWQKTKYLYTLPVGTFFSSATSLTAGTTYYYRCWASNSAGTSWASSTASFTTVAAGPTAPTVTNSTGASDIGGNSAKLNGKVTSTGGENPVVHIYWGPADGGTNPLNWANDVTIGVKPAGSFSKSISGLAGSTTYFYRCYGTNSAGTDWADSTAYFTTQAGASPPVVTNGIGATNVKRASITWNGEVVSTGGADPSVRIYYGTVDGGTNPANWQKVKYISTLPAGPFSSTSTGLTPNTTYYYRCWASNAAGTVWAPTSTAVNTLP